MKRTLYGCLMQRRSTGSSIWSNKRGSSNEPKRQDRRRRKMGTKSTREEHTVDITTKKQDHPVRLNFRNSQQREAHIHAFFAWLPKILHEVPDIRWERLPSPVMGYLIRTVADSPDAVCITLAVGCAMSAQNPKVLYSACTALTHLLNQLRTHSAIF